MIAKILLAVIASSALPVAQADDRTFDFDCDAPEGHFTSWSASTTAAALTITGDLRIHELRLDKKWYALFSVMIYGGADGKTKFGFRAYDIDQTQKKLHLDLLKPGGHIDFGNDALKPGKKSVPFKLELSATGTLSVDVGGAQQSAELGVFKPRSVDFGCSTGDFSFDDIRITERAAP